VLTDNRLFTLALALPQTQGKGEPRSTVPLVVGGLKIKKKKFMIFYSVGKFDHESSESCCLCLRFVRAGQFYVRTASRIAHYKCAKKKKWKRATRRKLKTGTSEIREFNKSIRLVRNGVVIKTVGV